MCWNRGKVFACHLCRSQPSLIQIDLRFDSPTTTRCNMAPSDSFVSHLAVQLGYSAGEFQALQLIVLAASGDIGSFML